MQRLCANNIAGPIGKITYTSMLNKRGGIESDCTITRVGEDKYMIVTSSAKPVREMDWINRNIKQSEFVVATDISSSLAMIGVMGPRSRALLSKLTNADLSNEAFPFSTSQEIDLNYAKVRASRITYVGELGWELYIPTEAAIGVYDALLKAGTEFGLQEAGYYAIESLRVEKAYRAWGSDVSPDETPLEAGLAFAVDFNKPIDFTGKEALLKQKQEGLKKRLVVFIFENEKAYPLGGEPILRNGAVVGYLSSGNFGHHIGKAVGMGYVKDPTALSTEALMDFIKTGEYQVEIAGEPWKVKAQLQAAYDPKGTATKM